MRNFRVATIHSESSGASIYISIDVDVNGQQMSFKCSGKFNADELNMTMDGGELKFEFGAKRVSS